MMKELNENEKVEALKEKWGASIMMLNEEYTVARKKLLCAQKLYPELDNINLMLTICDILIIASSFKLSYNEIDSNCILDLVYPSATYSDAIHNLHDLVISINSIRNEFPGSDLALEIVQNALSIVSDREKKHFHDKCHGFMHEMKGLISSNEILDAEETESALISEESLEEDEEYQQYQEFYNFEEGRRSVELFEPGQIWAVNYQHDEVRFKHHRYAKINFISGDMLNITWLKPAPDSVDERVWCDAGLPVACGAFFMDPKACDDVRTSVFSYKCSPVSSLMDHQVEIYPMRGEIWAVYKDGVVNEWIRDPELLEGSKLELIQMFTDYSKCSGGDFVCVEKVNGFCSVFRRLISGKKPILFHISPNSMIFSHKIPAHKLLGKEEAFFELDQMALPKSLIQHSDSNSYVSEKKLCEDKFLEQSVSNDFSCGQVWAIYSGKDTMLSQYAVINSVVSNREVCVTMLEPEAIHDYENKCRNVPVACGMFKHGNSNVILNVSQFSHLVKYIKSTTRPHYMIYPKKGEVWAVYKNWNRKWERSDYKNCQYWMVEIISDFSKENGIKLAKLEEVHNCLTFFQREQDGDFDVTCTVLEAEILCFSHQVLAYRIHGIERYGIPRNSWHLEPKAIPYL